MVCIPEFKANFLFFGIYIAWFLIYWSLIDHYLMASILEKAISILAGNLNSRCSYLITTVKLETDLNSRRTYLITAVDSESVRSATTVFYIRS